MDWPRWFGQGGLAQVVGMGRAGNAIPIPVPAEAYQHREKGNHSLSAIEWPVTFTKDISGTVRLSPGSTR